MTEPRWYAEQEQRRESREAADLEEEPSTKKVIVLLGRHEEEFDHEEPWMVECEGCGRLSGTHFCYGRN